MSPRHGSPGNAGLPASRADRDDHPAGSRRDPAPTGRAAARRLRCPLLPSGHRAPAPAPARPRTPDGRARKSHCARADSPAPVASAQPHAAHRRDRKRPRMVQAARAKNDSYVLIMFYSSFWQSPCPTKPGTKKAREATIPSPRLLTTMLVQENLSRQSPGRETRPCPVHHPAIRHAASSSCECRR